MKKKTAKLKNPEWWRNAECKKRNNAATKHYVSSRNTSRTRLPMKLSSVPHAWPKNTAKPKKCNALNKKLLGLQRLCVFNKMRDTDRRKLRHLREKPKMHVLHKKKKMQENSNVLRTSVLLKRARMKRDTRSVARPSVLPKWLLLNLLKSKQPGSNNTVSTEKNRNVKIEKSRSVLPARSRLRPPDSRRSVLLRRRLLLLKSLDSKRNVLPEKSRNALIKKLRIQDLNRNVLITRNKSVLLERRRLRLLGSRRNVLLEKSKNVSTQKLKPPDLNKNVSIAKSKSVLPEKKRLRLLGSKRNVSPKKLRTSVLLRKLKLSELLRRNVSLRKNVLLRSPVLLRKRLKLPESKRSVLRKNVLLKRSVLLRRSVLPKKRLRLQGSKRNVLLKKLRKLLASRKKLDSWRRPVLLLKKRPEEKRRNRNLRRLLSTTSASKSTRRDKRDGKTAKSNVWREETREGKEVKHLDPSLDPPQIQNHLTPRHE